MNPNTVNAGAAVLSIALRFTFVEVILSGRAKRIIFAIGPAAKETLAERLRATILPAAPGTFFPEKLELPENFLQALEGLIIWKCKKGSVASIIAIAAREFFTSNPTTLDSAKDCWTSGERLARHSRIRCLY